ncbi:TPA_asm: AEC family transporter [Listeria monocytogenes]|uniref:AEC family transporter n=1 Tax=Listeria monocytogenes TaxID=1639 RepID=UPI00061D2D09|nr:AEC family transporter [Listeria monocytogenes]EAC3468494.1 AEC family transporter [Listeria monocytogenes]EAD4206376.1 AEC family transporter [Listeria monocytogenes]EAE0129311.1 AEC family transporter [Listeria monocytogenes]EAE0144348.1 AEC family transporter [Listeria monocytogenes]EAE2796262.1 AEC family transporter [Listeria monocytogenes]
MEFLLILLPVFGIFAIGFVGQKTLKFDIPNLSKLTLYLMSPFLAFNTFYTNPLTIDYAYLAIYIFALCLSLILLVSLISFLLGYNLQDRCALILASAFMNNGNYGTPVVLLVFGAVGLDIAVVLMVLQQLATSTIGIYFAAKGSKDANGMKTVMKRVVRMPIAYGALLGLALQLLHVSLPSALMTCVKLVGDAAIPTIMIVLGMQLAVISFRRIELTKVGIALVLKLLIAPIIAFGLTLILPVDEMTKQIMILLAAMPTAANTTLMAVQFDTKPDLVSSATFISTVLSIITLPIVLYFLHPVF